MRILRRAFPVSRPIVTVLILLGILLPAKAQEQLSENAQRGLALVRTKCGRCHALYRTGDSPFPPAPPFRALHLRYPAESLEESLAEGIITGHPAMPEFSFDPDQIGDIIAYLKALEH